MSRVPCTLHVAELCKVMQGHNNIILQATGDPYYLDVGKSIVDKLDQIARVSCGYAAIKDVNTGMHEDR